MCRGARDQRLCFARLEEAGQHSRRQQAGQPEAGQFHRVPGQVEDRPQDLVAQVRETRDRGPEQPEPSFAVGAGAVGRFDQRTVHHSGGPSVERMGHVDFRPQPLETVFMQPQLLEDR